MKNMSRTFFGLDHVMQHKWRYLLYYLLAVSPIVFFFYE